MNHIHSQTLDNATLDALVDGELTESARHALLVRLDQEPEQWRRVALAFLEAQAFQAAWRGKELPSPMPQRMEPSAITFHSPAALRSKFTWNGLAVLAAALLLAFSTGWMMHGSGRESSLATLSTSPQLQASQQPPSPVLPSVKTAFSSQVTAELRQQLLRLGYEVQEQPRLIHIQQDGRSIPVYVNDLKVRFVGRREVL